MKKFTDILLFTAIILAILAIPYLAVCVIVKFLAFCFGFVFSFKLSLGIFTLLCLFTFFKMITIAGD